MKKEYLIGGLLGAVLCGLIAYAVMSVMGFNEGGTGNHQIQQVKEQPAVAPQSPDVSQSTAAQQPDSQDAIRQGTSTFTDNSAAAVSEKKPVNGNPSPAGGPSDGKAATESKVAQPGDGKLVKGLTAEQTARFDQITERKRVLQPEREKFIKEREQLHADVKNVGVVRTQGQIDAIAKRITDLEARINSFNAEVKKLNEEEKAIIDSAAAK